MDFVRIFQEVFRNGLFVCRGEEEEIKEPTAAKKAKATEAAKAPVKAKKEEKQTVQSQPRKGAKKFVRFLFLDPKSRCLKKFAHLL